MALQADVDAVAQPVRHSPHAGRSTSSEGGSGLCYSAYFIPAPMRSSHGES